MNKNIFLFSCVASIFVNAQSNFYSSETKENPLKTGTFYKIKVDKSGVFKITKKFLTENGINPNNINPKHLRIYGNGGAMLPEFNQDKRYSAMQEIAIQVVGEDDSVWDDSDYALFYAKGADAYNLYGNFGNGSHRRETRADPTAHLKNIYEDFAYYFLTFDKGEGKRIIEDNTPINNTHEVITKYDDYQFINNDKINLMKVGRIWADEIINNKKTISFQLKSELLPTDKIQYRFSIIGLEAGGNSYKYNINGNNEKSTSTNVSSPSFNYLIEKGTVTNLSGKTINLNLESNTSTNPNGAFYFNYFEVKYKQDLVFNGTQMNFRSYEIDENLGDTYHFSIANVGNLEQVWDISDITNAKRKINQSTKNTFDIAYVANNQEFNNEFVAFNHSSAYIPSFVGRVANQDLHSLQNIDYLVITRKDFIPQGQRLANYHATHGNLKTAVVDVEQIYNEYSSGSQDITAIRDFITSLNNENGGLKYVLILGDSSYDFKDRLSGNDNIIPSYESEYSADFDNSFVTDDYFVMTGRQLYTQLYNNLPNIPIGRLPASDLSEAKLLIDKTLAYYGALEGQSSPFGTWRMNLDFVVDDDSEGRSSDNNGIHGNFHDLIDDGIRNIFENRQKPEYNIKKLYFDAFPASVSSGGQRYPQINQAIVNDMSNSLYISYFGHGGINRWGQETVLSFNDINQFNNYNKSYSRFPVISTITCEFNLWDDPKTFSAGEQIVKHKNGGTATMITSSRSLGVSYGRGFNNILTKHLFRTDTNGDFKAMGDALLDAKKEYNIHTDHLKVNYLGDPAMKLSRPKELIKITNIETPIQGKIRALDKVKITGQILKEDKTNLDETFTGKVAINIFDKPTKKKTLNNDNASGMLPLLEFSEEGNPIAKTSGKVVNGVFEVEFFIPKDINFNDGEGRILVYADNFDTAKSQAHDVYANTFIQIGGINPDGINDNTPPKANIYMNNTNFANGGITNRNPQLLACLSDDTGINSTGTGIGHDITAILDGKVIDTILLNDFFMVGDGNGCNHTSNNFQKGSLLYPFRNLSVGQHELVFKVWDINNNSTTTSLNFIVKDENDQKLQINRLLNWPNPFTNKTYIQFEHNCDDVLDVSTQIFTITGKLVRSLYTTIDAEPFLQGYRTPKYSIEWDGRDDFGNNVAKGTYIFKVSAKAKNQNKCIGTAIAIEKMVNLK